MQRSLNHMAYFFTLLLCLIAFSCQKELIENNIARGSLKNASGICFDQVIHGTYYNNIKPGVNTAFVEVKVNVTSPGSYFIFTNEQNGLRFAESGYFKNIGLTTIRLKPTGAALGNVITSFSVFF